MEKFKQIPGFEKYGISQTGRVLSYKRGCIKQQWKNQKDGYWRVSLYEDGKVYTIETHKLVALTWLDKPEGEDMEAGFIDKSNKDDCSVNNVKWAPHSEHLRESNWSGKKKHSIFNIYKDNELVATGKSLEDLANITGVSPTRVWYCLKLDIPTSTGFVIKRIEKGAQ